MAFDSHRANRSKTRLYNMLNLLIAKIAGGAVLFSVSLGLEETERQRRFYHIQNDVERNMMSKNQYFRRC